MAPNFPLVWPMLTPQRAIELLREKIGQFESVFPLERDDPEVEKWIDTTSAILDAAFGKPNGQHHEMTTRFLRYPEIYINGTEENYKAQHKKLMLQRRGVLESCVEQLEILSSPVVQSASGEYVFHSEIERVSGQLLRDGHYKSAALEAYIRVINEVKIKSGLNFDGDKLMNHTFGCEG